LWNNWPRSADLFHGLNQRVESIHAQHTVSTFHDLFVLTGEYSTPEFRARFAAQALTDPAYHKIVIKDALASPSLVQVVDGITRCLPDLPMAVVTERNIMARNLMMHTCADFERAFTEAADVPRTSWSAVGSGLIDAIVGLWQAPVTEHP